MVASTVYLHMVVGLCTWVNSYTPRCNLKDPCNIIQPNIIHRPEEVLDVQSELIFLNGMVHLPQE